MLADSFRLMARYNQWMNNALYGAAVGLPDDALRLERGAFFGSILGTLNHIAVADTLWLKRFAEHPAKWPALAQMKEAPQPDSLRGSLFGSMGELDHYRRWLDQVIVDWAAALADVDLQRTLHYANTSGVPYARRFDGLVLHFFNHQTHHRGQATTLLFQAGVDVGVTDLATLLPNA